MWWSVNQVSSLLSYEKNLDYEVGDIFSVEEKAKIYLFADSMIELPCYGVFIDLADQRHYQIFEVMDGEKVADSPEAFIRQILDQKFDPLCFI